MLALEIACAALSTGAVVSVMMGRASTTVKWLAAGSLAAAAAQAAIEGPHWQICTEYLATLLVILIAFQLPRPSHWRKIACGWVLVLDACAVVLSFLLPIFSLPATTGRYAVGTTTLWFNDVSRPEEAAPGTGATRELKVQFWYPAEKSNEPFAPYRIPSESQPLSRYQRLVVTHSRVDAPIASAGAPFPLILFNPGWDSRRTIDTFLTEELASHGYFVASIDHPYNASLVSFPDGRVIAGSLSLDLFSSQASTPEQVKAAWNRELAKWASDSTFVLDRLETMSSKSGSPWSGRIDTKNTGAVGHSFGGATSTLLCARDPRIRAAINLDGWYFGAIEARGPNQPLLSMETSEPKSDAVRSKSQLEILLDATDLVGLKASMLKFGGYRVLVSGAQHEDFTDQPLVSPLRRLSHRGTVSTSEMQTIVRSYVLAFLEQELRHRDAPILQARSHPFAETSLETWAPDSRQSVSSINRTGNESRRF